MAEEERKKLFDAETFRIDPDRLDESIRELGDRIKKSVDTGRYTKVRLTYKGKQIGPDIPMGMLLAGEVATLWVAGPLRAIVFNLGIKSFIEVELIHQADELVAEGIALWQDGEVEAAEAKYREALDKRNDDTAALYHLGVLLRVTGRRDEALEILREAAADEAHPEGVKAREALDKMERGPRTL